MWVKQRQLQRDNFNCRNAAESQEKAEITSDGADNSNFCNFFFSDVLWNIGVFDVDQIVARITKHLYLQFSGQGLRIELKYMK